MFESVKGGLETVDGCGRLVVELEPANLGRDARVILGISRGRVAVGDVTKWVRRFMVADLLGVRGNAVGAIIACPSTGCK